MTIETECSDFRGSRREKECFFAVVLLLFAFWAGIATAGDVLDRETEFNIPAQPLDSALLAFSDQAGIQVVVAADSVKGIDSDGFAGHAPAREALKTLLDGSGLSYRTVGETVTVGQGGKAADQVQSRAERPSSTGEAVGGGPVSRNRSPAGAGKPGVVELEKISVTGSHIEGVRSTSAPVLTFDREDIERTGYSTLGQLMESLPQNFGGGASQDSIGTDNSVGNRGFGNAVNLRALGPGSTLVLLNGHRIAPAGNSGQFVDISMIPLSAIERVEVLTDGASAIYGADAVGGVVNVITQSNYQGGELALRYGNVTDGDAPERQATFSQGANWATGNAFLSYEYYHRDPLLAGDRSFAAAADPADTLLPKQKRESFFASLDQDLGLDWTAFGNLLKTSRDSRHRQMLHSMPLTDVQSAQNDQLQGSLGVRFDAGGDWTGELVASYSDYSMDSRLDRSGDITNVSVDTDTWSLDGLANGRLISLPGGDMRLALGAGYREENVNTIFGDDLPQRDVKVGYGELYVPIVGAGNSRPGVEALELNLAARYENYSDFGSEVTPKYGVRWSPLPGFSLRGSYGESFKAPTLAQLAPGTESYLAFIPSDFGIPINGDPLILARTQAAHPNLDAEKATNWTAGFDFTPEWSSFSASLTYYDIDFTDRIDNPTSGGFAEFFNSPDQFSNLIVMNPGAAFVNQRLSEATSFLDLTGGQFEPDAVGLFADLAITNIAAEKQSGFDLNLDYPFATTFGQFDLTLNANYISKFEKKLSPHSPPRDAVNVLFEPVDLRVRSGLSWNRGDWSAAVFGNFTDNYRMSRDPGARDIGSWTTFDFHLRYGPVHSESAILDGTSVSLSVQNLFDKNPPFVATPVFLNTNPGYDPTNADPLGRFVALELSKTW